MVAVSGTYLLLGPIVHLDTQPPRNLVSGVGSLAADMAETLEGLKLCRRFIGAASFDEYRGEEIYPGVEAASDDALLAFIRTHGQTVDHPVGTCRMGCDPLSVVDAELRVHGVEGLRVVDASIMPTLVSGNTNAPTIMIAEKGADLIRGSASP